MDPARVEVVDDPPDRRRALASAKNSLLTTTRFALGAADLVDQLAPVPDRAACPSVSRSRSGPGRPARRSSSAGCGPRSGRPAPRRPRARRGTRPGVPSCRSSAVRCGRAASPRAGGRRVVGLAFPCASWCSIVANAPYHTDRPSRSAGRRRPRRARRRIAASPASRRAFAADRRSRLGPRARARRPGRSGTVGSRRCPRPRRVGGDLDAVRISRRPRRGCPCHRRGEPASPAAAAVLAAAVAGPSGPDGDRAGTSVDRSPTTRTPDAAIAVDRSRGRPRRPAGGPSRGAGSATSPAPGGRRFMCCAAP